MADDTKVTLKADVAQLKKAFREAQTSIKVVNSEFKAATAGMDDWTSSADGLSAKLKQLKSTYEAQKTQLEILNEQYKKTVELEGESSTGAQNLIIKINNQKAAIAKTEKEMEEYEGKLDDVKSGSSGAESATDDLSDSFDDAKNSAEEAGDGFTVMKGVLADLAATAIKEVVSGLKDIAEAAKDAYLEYDEGADNIIKATGATGEAAEDLKATYKEVSKSILGDYGDIGSALGEVNTRFGFTGDALQECTEDFLKFADITGTDATSSVQLVSRAMGDAGIGADSYKEVLDALAVAAQASGISIDTLTTNITKYGAPMRALGMDTKESIAIFSAWEKAGVNTETAFAGMKTAISTWSKEGKDAREEFALTLEEIEACPDIASATTKAIEIFGKKAGPDLADAIQGGRFEYEDFLELIENSAGTVEDTYEETQSGIDKVQLALQDARTEMADFVSELVDENEPEIEDFISWFVDGFKNILTSAQKNMPKIKQTVSDVTEKFKEGVSWLSENLDTLISTGKTVATVLAAIWVVNKISSFVSAVKGAITIIKNLTLAVEAQEAAQVALNATNPFGWVTLAVVGVAGLTTALLAMASSIEKNTSVEPKLTEEQKKLIDETDKLYESYQKCREEREKASESIETEYGTYEVLWDELQNIVDANGKIKEGYEGRASVITGELSDALGVEIETVDGVIQKWDELKGQVDEVIQLQKAQAYLEAYKDDYVDALKNQEEYAVKYVQTAENYKKSQEEYTKANDLLNSAVEGGESKWAELSQLPEYAEYATDSWSVAVSAMEENVVGLHKAFSESSAAYNEASYMMSDSATLIANCDAISEAIAAGNTENIETLMLNLTNSFQTCETGTTTSLKKQTDTLKQKLKESKAAMKAGAPGITQEYINALETMCTQSELEYQKAASIAEHGGQTAGIAYGDGAEEGLTSSNGKIQAAVDYVLDQAVNGKTSDIRARAALLGNAFGEGFSSGIEEAAWQVNVGVESMISSALATAQKAQDSHSPSKKTAKLGRYFTEGFAAGISDKARAAMKSAKSMVESAMSTLQGGIDTSSISSNGKLQVAASGGGSAGNVVNNYNFNQTNNSPKALSRLEIYRQSKNLLKLK